MKRRRYQKGSLQQRKHGKRRVWAVQYYDADGHHRYHTLGRMADLTKGQAEEKQQEFMRTINGGKGESDQVRPVLMGEFVKQVYLPFQRGKWKHLTRGTSENRIMVHIVGELGNNQIESFAPTALQAFLDRKALTHSFSTVDHLRWDLSSIFDLAVAEKVIPVNPATHLYTPKCAKKGICRRMSVDEAETALNAAEGRERLILHLAILSGFRPGEMFALRRNHVAHDRSSVEVIQRVYRGRMDDPKNGEFRSVAIPPRTAGLLREWLDTAVDPEPEAWVFASETRRTPLWRDNLLRRYIRPALEKVGLGWVDFKVMRRTHASLGHEVKVDPKVSADQRGHGIGVAIIDYTKSSLQQKATAAKKLENAILGRKRTRMAKKAS